MKRSSRVHGNQTHETRTARGTLGGLLIEQGRLEDAATVYGNKRMPDSFGIEEWLQGDTSLHGEEPTLLLFWESWCPYSQRQIPEFEIASRPYRENGLNVVSFARAEYTDGKEQLVDFIQDKGLTLPTARTTTEPWKYFEIPGTPSAVAIRDGRVVFQGNLYLVTEEFLRNLTE